MDTSAGTPSHDTFRKVFGLLNPDLLENVLIKWISDLREQLGIPLKIIAVDGKSLNPDCDQIQLPGTFKIVRCNEDREGHSLLWPSYLKKQLAVLKGSRTL